MLSQQLNDLLCKAFTVDVNGNIAIRMTVQSGNTQYWKDPVASLANLPSSGNTLGDIRMTLDDGVIYRWDGTTWLSGASVWAGQWLSLTGSTLAISLDTNSGLQFISGKLAVKPDWTTLESVAGTLRVKPGVFASSTHTHTSADITDWTTALNTWLALKSTTNLAEGTNLYYTQARFDSAFTAKSTTNLAEGTNLYYTDARVISAITGGASSISNVNLTINRALISDASGKVAVSSVTNTELGYLSGVTSAIQTQINGKQASLGYTAENTANKGAVNGYASLDGTGKVPSSQLPSFVDDVLEYANLASFPATGSTGILYVALDTNKVYRWSGSAYVEISGSPGSTDAVPEGSTNLYFTTARVLATALTGLSLATGTAITASDTILSAMGKLQKQITDLGTSKENSITAGTTAQYWRGDKSWQTLDKTAVGLANVDNTSDANKPVSTATQTALNLKANLISPAFTTPDLGTPSAGNLSNCTADGTNKVGYLNIPQNSQSVAYTLVLADAGKHIYHPSADTTARTFTIPANSSVAFPIGTAITFVNDTSAGAITIAITTDTLVLAGAGTTGSRTLASNGVATAIKVTSTRWIISGTNLT